MNSDFFSDLEKEAADVSSVPTDAGLARLRKASQEMVDLDLRKKQLEEELKAVNIRLWDVQTRELPDLFAEVGVDNVGLPSAGVDVAILPYAHANIKADLPDEERESAFDYLASIGGGGLVRNEVTLVFARGEEDLLQEWLEKVRNLNLSFDPPDVTVKRAVHWGTLTAFVKEQVGKGTVLDLKKLGATVGSIAKIQKRN